MRKKYVNAEGFLMPDSVYGSKLISKFINCMMQDGKKGTAQKIFYGAMNSIGQKIQDAPPLEVFEAAMENVKPMLEVRSKRVGGASYQVPMQVAPKRQQSLAIRWILAAARSKKGKPMAQRLASELMDAYRKEGAAITTRENVHRMAEANKAFAHFAW